jgi:hypothetical protein
LVLTIIYNNGIARRGIWTSILRDGPFPSNSAKRCQSRPLCI